MKRKVLVIVAALVATQLLSGCFFLRELTWNKDKLAPGDKTNATISLQAIDDGPDGYFFVLPALESDLRYKGANFDQTRALGNRQRMVEDTVLGNEAFDQCVSLFAGPRLRGPGSDVTAFRTEGVVADNRENKFVEARLKVRAPGSSDAPGGFGVVFTGIWVDDGDEIPEADDDQIDCTGFSSTSLLPKGGIPESARIADALGD